MWGNLRALGRLMRILGHLLKGVVLTALSGGGDAGAEKRRCIRHAWYDRLLTLCGVHVQVLGNPPEQPALVVANHVSWLDVALLGAALDPAFLSKAEVGRWPVIGWLARRHETRFIERGGHQSAALAEALQAGLAAGERPVVFPEGTTSHGGGVRRFYPRLFAAVAGTGYPVQPVALDYERPAGEGTPVAFIGNQGLLANLWRLLQRPQTRVSLHFLAPLDSTRRDRRELAEASRTAIVQALGVPAEPLSSPDRARRGAGKA